MTDRLPPLPPDFGKGMMPNIDDFAWITEKRREPKIALWFWVDEVHPIFDKLEKALAELLKHDPR